MGIKSAVEEAVQNKLATDTALVLAPGVLKSSQAAMQDDIQASHINNMGMMAIENAIEEDKAQYEQQLDELRKASEATTKRLTAAKAEVEKEVNSFRKHLIHTELRAKYAAAFKLTAKFANLTNKFIDKGLQDATYNVEGRAPSKDADVECDAQRVPHFKWSFRISDDHNHNDLHFVGYRKLSSKCLSAKKAVEDVEKDLTELSNANRDIRISIQNLERERRDLQRKLRHEIVSKSSVGAQIEKVIRQGRKPLKQLQLPSRLTK